MATARFTAKKPALDALYEDLAGAYLQPLWELEGLLTREPRVKAVPYRWRAEELGKLARRAGDLVPVGRGGDRRVLAMSNPGLDGLPFVSGTLWAAVQYLQAHESAPAHRHTPAALRFVLEGEGVYTLVDGDPLAMRRGDLVLTPSWAFHEHHNPTDVPMTWLDVLDLPVVAALDAVFFEGGPSEEPDRSSAPASASEQRWGTGAGLAPQLPDGTGALAPHSPLLVYRWDRTDAALGALLDASGGRDATLRFTDPARGRDVMPTMRCEMRRVLAGTTTAADRQTGTRLSAVLGGAGQVTIGGQAFDVAEGDVFVVPSWCWLGVSAESQLDIFSASDAPVLDAVGLFRRAEAAA